jgi:hypothetical protein
MGKQYLGETTTGALMEGLAMVWMLNASQGG